MSFRAEQGEEKAFILLAGCKSRVYWNFSCPFEVHEIFPLKQPGNDLTAANIQHHQARNEVKIN